MTSEFIRTGDVVWLLYGVQFGLYFKVFRHKVVCISEIQNIALLPFNDVLFQDPDYEEPTKTTLTPRTKKYCTVKLGDAITAVARFNIGYGQASHMCTGMAKDLGQTETRITKKKIRGQLESCCKKEIKKLNGTEIRGKLFNCF